MPDDMYEMESILIDVTTFYKDKLILKHNIVKSSDAWNKI